MLPKYTTESMGVARCKRIADMGRLYHVKEMSKENNDPTKGVSLPMRPDRSIEGTTPMTGVPLACWRCKILKLQVN